MLAAGVDVIYTVLFAPEWIPFVQEMAQADPDSLAKLFVADAQATTDASDGIEDLTVGIAGLRPSAGDLGAWQAFFSEAAGEDAMPFTEFSFDAAVLCVAAAAAAGSVDPVAIRDNLRDISAGGTAYDFTQVAELITAAASGEDVDYVGAGSPVNLDENGDVDPTGAQYVVWSFDDAGEISDGEILSVGG